MLAVQGVFCEPVSLSFLSCPLLAEAVEKVASNRRESNKGIDGTITVYQGATVHGGADIVHITVRRNSDRFQPVVEFAKMLRQLRQPSDGPSVAARRCPRRRSPSSLFDAIDGAGGDLRPLQKDARSSWQLT